MTYIFVWKKTKTKKTLTLPFSQTLFQTLQNYNRARGLHFHCRFDDLDFVSRSPVCQKYKLQIVLFICLSTEVSTSYIRIDHARYGLSESSVYSMETIYLF